MHSIFLLTDMCATVSLSFDHSPALFLIPQRLIVTYFYFSDTLAFLFSLANQRLIGN